MDIDLEKRIDETMEWLNKLSVKEFNYKQMDPVAKMMLVALANEVQKIEDAMERMDQRIADRFFEDFIPRQLIEPVPAIVLLCPKFRTQRDTDLTTIGSNAVFTYKIPSRKQALNYIPIFKTEAIPYTDIYLLTPENLITKAGCRSVYMESSNTLWVGIHTKAEMESMQGMSLLIKGTRGIGPQRVCVGTEERELTFATMSRIEDIEMVEPFDAQQSSGAFFSFLETWKQGLLGMDDAVLIYITDVTRDRDLFKPRSFPREFQQWLESEVLDSFDPQTLWIRIEFPKNYLLPGICSVIPNVFPVANIDVCNLMLTQASPIAKLQKQENAYFLQVLETSNSSYKQGFNLSVDEILIRDFDVSRYHNGELYRDIRNLYNRFIDDYYAFIEYNGIKDGESLKQLRENINRLSKGVGEQNEKFKFDSGTYVMKNMRKTDVASSIRVSYITTQGKIGNSPSIGEMMENKKLPVFEKDMAIIESGMCGTDKASVDERYELLRYYSLTSDRLYTQMDVNAFLRKEIISEFGKEEFRRISIEMKVEGTGGTMALQRGLYIDIGFKDRKNYEHAVQISFDAIMKRRIENKACIAMPIMVTLRNLEE